MNKITSKTIVYLLIGIAVLGIIFIFTGIAVGSQYRNHDIVAGYTERECHITNATIVILKDCNYKNIHTDAIYVPVWSNNGITVVNTPFSEYRSVDKAQKDIMDGPIIGTIVRCMCNSDYKSEYPATSTSSYISGGCQVWKACMLDVKYMEKLKVKTAKYNQVGKVFAILGLSMSLGIVIIVIGYHAIVAVNKKLEEVRIDRDPVNVNDNVNIGLRQV